MRHLKFVWLDSVHTEPRFTSGDKIVLTYCALNGVYGKQHDFTLHQTLIAERVGVDVRTVQRAFAKATKLGYLAMAEPRKRGRGHRKADRHRIVMPSPLSEIPDRHAGNSRHLGTEIADICDTENAVLPGETPPVRVKDRLFKGSGPLRDASPPPCPDHPSGYRHSIPCGPCGKLREWERTRPTPTPPQHVPQGPPEPTTRVADDARRAIRRILAGER